MNKYLRSTRSRMSDLQQDFPLQVMRILCNFHLPNYRVQFAIPQKPLTSTATLLKMDLNLKQQYVA